MRRARMASTLVLAAGLLGAAEADEIVFKDGRTMTTSGPMVIKGRQALLKMPDGTLVSIALSEIDLAKTEQARKKAAEAKPTPPLTPAAEKPLTPAEAARIHGKRKAAVALTDEDVAQRLTEGEEAGKKEETDRVEVTNTAANKIAGGFAITGSVTNMGKTNVTGVSVTVEAVGDENRTLVSTFGTLAKDDLAPGEKSTFTATLVTDKEPKLFRYLPTWQAKPAPGATQASAKGGGGASAGEGAASEPSPTPQAQEPEKKPTPTYIPRPDVAPPAPNAPKESEQPGGTFLPNTAGEQPKPPSGG